MREMINALLTGSADFLEVSKNVYETGSLALHTWRGLNVGVTL